MSTFRPEQLRQPLSLSGSFTGSFQIGGDGSEIQFNSYNNPGELTGSNQLTFNGNAFKIRSTYLGENAGLLDSDERGLYDGDDHVIAMYGVNGNQYGYSGKRYIYYASTDIHDFLGDIHASDGNFVGNLTGTADTASYIDPTFISASAAASGFGSGGGDTSGLVTTASFNAYTGSTNLFTSSILSFTQSINNATSSFATTGSNTFRGNQTITGSLQISGSEGITGSVSIFKNNSSTPYNSIYSHIVLNNTNTFPTITSIGFFSGSQFKGFIGSRDASSTSTGTNIYVSSGSDNISHLFFASGYGTSQTSPTIPLQITRNGKLIMGSGVEITGNPSSVLTVNGNLSVESITTTTSITVGGVPVLTGYKTYAALLTQTGESNTQTINSGTLTVGITYKIETYITGGVSPINLPTIDKPGTGYSDASNVSTTLVSGNGTGLTVDITTSGGEVTAIAVNNPGQNYSIPTTVKVNGGNNDCELIILDLNPNDNFTNVGASSDTAGTTFIATADTPDFWFNKSVLSYNNGAPTVKLLQNKLNGYSVGFVYSNTGSFYVTASGDVFTTDKTAVFFGDSYGTITGKALINYNTSTTSRLDILTYSGSSPVTSSGVLSNTPIEIRVYS